MTGKDGAPKIIEYSVILPVYNEEESLEPMLSEILQAMIGLRKVYEVIFVDDCSDDKTPQILKEFQERLPEIVKVFHLKERSGQTFAMRYGLDQSQGLVAITLDADLQNDPADIPKLLSKMEEGFDCVCGWRKSRQDSLLKAGLSKFGNVLQRLFTGLKIHDVSCTLRAYKKKCVPKIPLNWEGQHRFIPLSLSLQGFSVGEIVSNHRLRSFGTTKYSHKRIFRVISDFFKILAAKGKA